MNRFRLRRPSPALLVAMLAVVLAGAGSGHAADAAQSALKKLTGKQIKDNTIRSKDIRNRSLLAKDFKPGQLPAGPPGAPGAPGPTGPAGPIGPSKAYADNAPGPLGDAFSRVLEVSVAPGSYTAQVNLEVHAVQANAQVECKFRADGAEPALLGYTGVLFLGDVPASGLIDSRTISFGGGFTTSTGGVVEMVCKRGAKPAESTDGDLVVTRVGELTL